MTPAAGTPRAPDISVRYGDAWQLAETLAPASIDCIVTSPPYWGLRDYGHPEQFGLEPTPQEYVAKLVDLFARLRPALKDEGTVWLNLGDSYASDPGKGGSGTPNGRNGRGENYGRAYRPGAGRADGIVDERGQRNRDGVPRGHGLKPKDLCGIPWRVAFALQEDGWWLRSDIIWAKPNPMPESVTDRPTKAHEYLFLLAKSQRYYFDADAVREAHLESSLLRAQKPWNGNGQRDYPGQEQLRDRGDAMNTCHPNGRNIRTVWSLSTRPYSGAHFAVFPHEIPERCIKAGTSERGVCPECGKAWERVVERTPMVFKHSAREAEKHASGLVTALHGTLVEPAKRSTTGWQPACTCNADPVPGTVLDPFVGSGTTLEVARKLGRNAVGFELNEDYRALIEDRLKQGVLC